MSNGNPSGRDDHAWKVCYGLSALLGLFCVCAGLLFGPGCEQASAVCFVGAGVIFALLGIGLRSGNGR